jgi:leucyl/phenylalanyl-tRNA--protein transferase
VGGGRTFEWPHLIDPGADPVFPDGLEPDEHGLIAVGGALSERILVEAYGKGIFPWFVGPPIMWFSPNPRLVLYPSRFHLSRRLARTVRQARYQVEFDRDFERVMIHCAAVPRKHEEGTWIDRHFLAGYSRLHRRHITHCVSTYLDGELCGGLYGLTLGRVFFGESMFALRPDASKVAFYHLVRWLDRRGFRFIDCQVRTEHLVSLGAEEIPRDRFLRELHEALQAPSHHYPWRDDPEAGRPDGARPEATRPDGARPEATRPGDARPEAGEGAR